MSPFLLHLSSILEFWTIWNAKSSYFGFVFSEQTAAWYCSHFFRLFVPLIWLCPLSFTVLPYPVVLIHFELEYYTRYSWTEWVFVVWDLEISIELCWEAFTFSDLCPFPLFPLSYILHDVQGFAFAVCSPMVGRAFFFFSSVSLLSLPLKTLSHFG